MKEFDEAAIERTARALLEEKMWRPLDRRQFVRRFGGALIVSGFAGNLLAACGGDDGEEEGAPAEEAGGEVGGQLSMIVWDGYDDKEASKGFLAENDVKVAATYIGNNEEIFTKLRGGGVGQVDLVTPYHGYIKVLVEADLATPLDYSRIPSTENYISNFDKPEWLMFDGEPYGAPYIWGTDPMMYDAKVIKEPPQSWLDVKKPEYKGKVVMVDDTLGQIMVWGRVLGYEDPTKITSEQLDEVINLLIDIKKNHARTVAPSWGDMADIMARGDAVISTGGWEAITTFAAEKGADIQFTHPEEGDFAWTDSWVIPKDAPNEATAYAWIEAMIAPEAQAIVAKNLSSGTVNEQAVELMDEQTRSIYPYDNLESVFEKAPNFDIPPREPEGDLTTLDDWNKAWERFRAA
jgi:spermidine/putrescine transport system substrate-binding protein